MIILDRSQACALQRAATAPIRVNGLIGTGKTTLANALAVQVVTAGLRCLLVGRSALLEQPLAYGLPGVCHPVLAHRSKIAARPVRPPDSAGVFGARGRLDPSAAQFAKRVLDRSRQLLAQYPFSADEVERTLVVTRPEAADLLAVAAEDAARIADMLWLGDKRNERSLRDVETLIAGGRSEVPPDGEFLPLIVAGDDRFEHELATILVDAARVSDERNLGAAVAALAVSPSPGQTLAELHEHTVWLTQVVRDAIALVNMSGSPAAALAKHPRALGARVLERFLRVRPDQDASTAVSTFEQLLRRYESDEAAFAPHVERYGTRTVASVTTTPLPNPFPPRCPDVGTFAQRVREARYAARSLPGALAKMRAIMPPALWDEIVSAPIEEATTRFETGRMLNERTRAASELRHLRDIFAGIGFGDLLTAPADFAAQADAIASRSLMAASVGPAHSPEALDILLDATAPGASFALANWPAAIVRVRSPPDLAAIEARGDRFDVLIADDAGEFAPDALDRFSAAGTRVHRIGVEIEGDTIVLERPHRQRDAVLADLASRRPGRWLAAPIELGVFVREAGGDDLDSLRAAAARTAEMLRLEGCNTVLAPGEGNGVADVIVAVLDTLRDADLHALATSARDGIVVLCRRDLRVPAPAVETIPMPDAVVAQSLGWRIKRICVDGVLVEKDGRCVALVDEPLTLTAVDEVVTDVVGRLAAAGWRPVVAWRNAPRAPRALDRLLNACAVPVAREHLVRTLAETLEVRRPTAPTVDADMADDIPIAPVTPVPFLEPRVTVRNRE